MRIFEGKIGHIIGAAVLMAAAPIAPVAAQEVVEESFAEPLTEAVADMLEPGDYRWQPAGAAEGPLAVIVSIWRQMAYVYRGDTLIGVATVSTGKPGHDTPTGSFPILQKKVDHRSNLYNNAPMPFMQRLTWDGIALHGGDIPGHPASHGCVRLPTEFARLLYGETRLGMTVTIQEEDPFGAPMELAETETLGPDPGLRMAGYSESAGAR